MSGSFDSDKDLWINNSIFENSLDAILLTKPDGTILAANPAAEKMFGMTEEEFKAAGRDGIVVQVDKLESDLEERSQKGRFIAELTFKRKDGTTFPGEVTSTLFTDDNDIVKIHMIITDITERKQADKALRESEFILRSFFDTAGVMRGIVDVVAADDVRHIADNAVTAAFVGLTPEAMRNKLGSELGEPRETLRTWVGHYEESRRTGKPVTFEYLDLRENVEAWLAATVNYLGTNQQGEHRFAYVVIDITEQKKSEDALRESEENYRHLLQYAPTAIYEIDFKGPSFKSVNDALCQLSGYSREELLSTNPLDILDSESQHRFQQRIRQGLAGEKIEEKVDYTVIRKDGRKLWVTLNIKPTYKDGNIDGALVVGHDITERKKAEDALRESEEHYRSILDNIQDAYMRGNNEGVITMVSPSAARIYGFDSPQEMVGVPNLWLYKNPEDRNYVLEELKKHGKLEDYESEGLRADGTSFSVSMNAQFHYDEQGQIQGTEAFVRDITERKKTEERLQYTNERLNVASRAAKAGLWDWDIKTGHIEWTPMMFELLGIDSQKTSASFEVWGSALHPEDVQIANQRIEKAVNEHKFLDSEYRIMKPDGQIRWINALGETKYDEEGNPLWMTGICIDITQRKQTEIELKETLNNLEELVEERTKELSLANAYNRNLLETALDPLVTIGPDGKITDVNKATEEVTGYPREELVGTDFADYFTNPKKAKEGYQQVFQEGKVRDYPLKIKHRCGITTPVLYNASVYKDESGDVVGVFAAARDITERQKAEDAFRVYWESLEEQVEQRTEELAKSNADLKQFAYVASHDLREPLRMITSFLQLLERRYKDELDEDANEFIGFAVDGAKRLDNMIMDLLEYSRVANKEIQFTDVDLEEVIDKIKSNLNILIEEHSATINYDSLPTIRSDENQMLILLQNLISNAIKYRSEETPQIHISAEKQANQYIFGVKDNGIGIDPKHLERIFTIFQRLHTHEEYEGSGIGLSIAQRIVHQHGGEIWAESLPEQGSTFYFTIPET
jgi:PAS domain S-box-containing protein